MFLGAMYWCQGRSHLLPDEAYVIAIQVKDHQIGRGLALIGLLLAKKEAPRELA